jgi:hypothetical protein
MPTRRHPTDLARATASPEEGARASAHEVTVEHRRPILSPLPPRTISELRAKSTSFTRNVSASSRAGAVEQHPDQLLAPSRPSTAHFASRRTTGRRGGRNAGVKPSSPGSARPEQRRPDRRQRLLASTRYGATRCQVRQEPAKRVHIIQPSTSSTKPEITRQPAEVGGLRADGIPLEGQRLAGRRHPLARAQLPL